jgi:hypothetical protein
MLIIYVNPDLLAKAAEWRALLIDNEWLSFGNADFSGGGPQLSHQVVTEIK